MVEGHVVINSWMQVIGIRRVFFTCFVVQNKCFINQKPINLRLKTNKIKCYGSTLLGTPLNTRISSCNFQHKFCIFFLDWEDFRRLLITQVLWEKDQSFLFTNKKRRNEGFSIKRLEFLFFTQIMAIIL